VLAIVYLVLALVSYFAMTLALNVSEWLVILFVATFAFSMVGFSHTMAGYSRNALDRSKYLPATLTYYVILCDHKRTSRAIVVDADGHQILRNWLDAEKLRALIERRALAMELRKPLPCSNEYDPNESYRQKFIFPAKLTIENIDGMVPKDYSK